MGYAADVLMNIRKGAGIFPSNEIVRLATIAKQGDPLDLRSLIDIAILLRDRDYRSESREFCQHILNIDPNYAFALYEWAVLDAMEGSHVDALLKLERIINLIPDDERSILFAARMSARIGDYAAANSYLNKVDEISPTHPNVPWHRELVSFMQRFPAKVADRLARIYEIDKNYVDASTTIGWAAASLQRKEGFSLIRLGDGEGAFCRISSEDESRYPNIYRHCRLDRSQVWFNGEIDIDASGFTETAFSLRAAIQEANVVGMPYRSWVRHEYKYCGPTGIVCLVNALRLGQIAGINKGQSWTSQIIHMEFLRNGSLERLIRHHKKISVITCLSGAAQAIKSHFELDEVRLYRVPGEKLHASILGDEVLEGRHYPERFNELIQELSEPLDGQLFLVAAGILGKLYCNRIKKSGGVALDIGSAIDAWMGKATRPNIEGNLLI